ESSRHVARRLTRPVQQRSAQDIQRARAVLKVGFLSGLFARRRRFVAHPVELLGTNEKANRIPRRIVLPLWRRPAFEADHFQSSGGQLLRHDPAHTANAHDTNVTNIRDSVRHATLSLLWRNPPPPARYRPVC